MVNGRPETYREIAVLSKVYKLSEYIQIPGGNIVEKVCDYLLESPANKVAATPDNLMFLNAIDVTQEIIHVHPVGKTFNYIEMTADRWNIRLPHSSSSGSGGSSSNNNNNNNS